MATVARIAAKSGKLLHKVALHKGGNVLHADADTVITIVDDTTGKAVAQAELVRHGNDVTVNLPEDSVGLVAGGAELMNSAGSVIEPGTGGGLPASSGDGGGSHLLLPLLGLGALGGLVAAVAGGSGSGSGGTAAAPTPAAPTGLALAAADDSGTSSTDGITKLTSGLTISGTAAANASITLVEGGTTVGTGTADSSGHFSIDVALAEGTHAITAKAANGSGPASAASTALSITVDTAAPSVPTGLALAAADDTGASSSDHVTNQTSALTITGAAEAGSSVAIKDGSSTLATVTADGTGHFTYDASLAAGVHSLTATATDVAGNVSAASTALSITVDTTPPTAPTGLALAAADDTGISSSDQVTNQTSALTITGAAEAGSSVAIKDGSSTLATVTADGTGHFTYDASLAAGVHSLTATATDVAGNVSAASTALSITVDTTAPTLAVTSDHSSLLGAQTATLTFTFNEAPVGFATSDVTVTGGTISNLAVSPSDPKVYTATLTPAITGQVLVSVAAGTFADVAGNQATVGGTATLAYDAGSGGAAIDGYVSNALVFRDSNGDGILDNGEYSTVTDAQGNFTGLYGTGAIVLTPLINGSGVNLSVDIATGQAFTGHYSAPDGSTVVTPLTTIVQALVASGASAADAQMQVKAALGIIGSVDLATFDPLAAASNPETSGNAVGVQKAAIQVANILSVVASATTAAGATDGGQSAISAAASAIAQQITSSPGGSVDLSSATVLQSVVQSVASASTNPTVSSALANQGSGISDALANVNTAVQQASGSSVTDTFAAITTAQIVAQSTLGTDVAHAITSNTVLDSSGYVGTGLADKIDSAASQVQSVLPSSTPVSTALGAPDRPVIDPLVGTRVSGVEANAGVAVTVSYDATKGVAAGDELRLYSGDTLVKTYTLTSGDIPATGNTSTHSFTLSATDLGADGAKSLTAEFVHGALEGPRSFPLVLTLDTAVLAPSVDPVSGGYVNLAEAGGTVTGTLGGVEAGAVTHVTLSGTSASNPAQTLSFDLASSGKTFSIDPGVLAALADGTLTVTAGQTDAVSNVSAVATSTFVLDRVIATPTLQLSPLHDTGSSNNDGVTNQSSGLTLTGAAEAGASVAIKDGATALATVTADGTGHFTYDATLAQGAHSLTATATDLAGNVSAATGALAITVDTTAPATPSGLALAAASDTGVSHSDGITNQSSGLTVTGAAEAGASVVLMDGASILATVTADSTGHFSYTASLAEGAHSLTATATDLAGNVSAVSGTLAITVDATAPAAPSVIAAEGPILTLASAADGTQFTGSAESGSTVTLVLGNGASSLTKTAVATNGAFSISLTQGEITGLGEGAVHYQATATDAAGNVSGTSPLGQYIYTSQTVVDSSTRLDTAGSPPTHGDESQVGLSPLAGGGLVTSWSVDTNGDGEADSIALQRIGADGSLIGSPVVVTHVPQVLTSGPAEIASHDVTALADGGYVFAYRLEQPETTHSVTIGGVFSPVTNTISVITSAPITGVPETITVSNVPPGVTFGLSGIGLNGATLVTPLTVTNGTIEVSPAVIALYQADNRFNLVTNGVNPQQTIGNLQTFYVTITAREDVAYDTSSALTAIHSTPTVTQVGTSTIGLGVLTSTSGRNETFHIDTITVGTLVPGTSAPTVVMSIAPSDPTGFNLSGISGASLMPNGVIQINMAYSADGNYAVPASILSQLGSQDASVTLAVVGVALGSTFSGTIGQRPPVEIPQGVFVLPIDANGVAGTPSAALDSAAGAQASHSESSVSIAAISGGGYAVHWGVDSNGDGQPDTVAFQRFAADGTAQGAPLLLTNISPAIINNPDLIGNVDVQQLSNGHFALAYSLEQPTYSFVATTVPAASLQSTQSITFSGIPHAVYITSAPSGASYSLVALAPDGTPTTVPVSVVNGLVQITPDVLAQFAAPANLTLQVTNVPAGLTVTASVVLAQNVHYDTSSSLHDVSTTLVATLPGPFANSALGYLTAQTLGRAEAFHVSQATFISGQPAIYALSIITTKDVHSYDISQIAGASYGTNNQITINGVSPDANGNLAVPAALLAQLGSDEATITLVAVDLVPGSTFTGTASVRDSIANPEGVFVQNFDANGVGQATTATRLDGGATQFSYDNAYTKLGVTPQADGGYVVHWITDANNNIDGDGVALQRFNADGSLAGGVVVLQGFDASHLASGSTQVYSDAVTVLANGDYAFSYAADLPLDGRLVTSVANAANISGFSLADRPEQVTISSAPAGATYTLNGTALDGTPLAVVLQASNGQLNLPASVLAQYLPDSHFNIQVGNVPSGQSVTLQITGAEAVHIDPATPLQSVSTSSVATGGASATAFAAVGHGRAESFHIDTASFVANATPNFVLVVTLERDPSSYNLSGIPGLIYGSNDQVNVSVKPDANGNIAVPPALLAAMGTEDAAIVLVAIGLTPGSTFATTAQVHYGTANLDGVYTQTFDSTGHALSTDLTLHGTTGADQLIGGNGNDTINTGGGADIIHAGAGNDTIIADGTIAPGTIFDGGAGNDVLHLTVASQDFMAGNGSAYVPLFNAQLSGIETIQFDSTANHPIQAIVTLGQLTDGMTISGGAAPDTLIITAPQDNGTYNLPQLTYANWTNGSDVTVFTVGGTANTNLQALNHQGTNTLVLVGNDGNNTLVGGSGSEVLNGGAGTNTLTGGGGADLFVLQSPHGQTLAATDVITDFQVGTDHMQLSGGLTFASLDLVQGNPGTNGASATDTLVINHASGDILARLSAVDATTLTAAAFLASA